MLPLQAARRPLPAGFDVPDHPFVVMRFIRTHYQCVSVPADAPTDALALHDLVCDLAATWAYDDHVKRFGRGVLPSDDGAAS